MANPCVFPPFLFRTLLICLLLLASFASAVRAQQGATAAKRQVVNIADLRWDAGREEVVRTSNSVVVAISDAPATGFSILPYQLSGAGDARPTPVANPVCQGSGGARPTPLDAAATAGGALPTLLPATSVHAGEPLYFILTYAAANTDPTRINSLTGAILSKSGDREVLTIFETGPDTGVFSGVIQTRLSPPGAVQGDCVLSVTEADTITVQSLTTRNGFPLLQASVPVLVDPYGVTFDSEDGSLIDGVTVTLIDEATGAPARVRSADGAADYPATVVTGRPVTDSLGRILPGIPGDYRFPLVAHGRYHLVVVPPDPYRAPSQVSPAGLAGLRRADGQPMTIADGSYGRSFAVDTPEAVRIDIPLDRPRIAATVTKVADVALAAPGDLVVYTVTVANPDPLRAPSAVCPGRYIARGDAVAPRHRAARRRRRTQRRQPERRWRHAHRRSRLGAAGLDRVVRYALEVRADATDGVALNRARARDAVGTDSGVAEYAVRIARESIADRMTIIGRVTDGGCDADPMAVHGVGGVRILLEDGSYAVTDRDGRYHLQGILPGLHVVGLEAATLPPGARALDCAHDTRTAGSAISRFVEGTGGSLHRADFHIVAGAATKATPSP